MSKTLKMKLESLTIDQKNLLKYSVFIFLIYLIITIIFRSTNYISHLTVFNLLIIGSFLLGFLFSFSRKHFLCNISISIIFSIYIIILNSLHSFLSLEQTSNTFNLFVIFSFLSAFCSFLGFTIKKFTKDQKNISRYTIFISLIYLIFAITVSRDSFNFIILLTVLSLLIIGSFLLGYLFSFGTKHFLINLSFSFIFSIISTSLYILSESLNKWGEPTLSPGQINFAGFGIFIFFVIFSFISAIFSFLGFTMKKFIGNHS